MQKLTKAVSVAVMLLVALSVNVFAGGGTEGGAEPKGEINLTYMNWEEGVAWTHFVAAVLEDEYGYEVNLTAADVGIAYSSLFSGDQDFLMEAWLPGLHSTYVEGQDYEEVAKIYDDGVTGLIVPRYMYDDGVTKVSDLAKPEVVEKLDGKITGIDAGAGMMMQVADVMFPEYGLEEAGLELVPSSSPAMLAEMQSRIAAGEYVVGMGWQPHSMFGRMDIVILEQDGAEVFPIDDIFILGRPGATETFPEVAEFMSKVYWTNDTIGSLMVYISDSSLDTLEAAREWKNENTEIWSSWVSN